MAGPGGTAYDGRMSQPGYEQEPDWRPFGARPQGLFWPVKVDPTGSTGPTRGQTRGRAWRRSSAGFYVPSAVDSERVEQRILEAAAPLQHGEAVTGWAALRWRGAVFFDGRLPDGSLRPIRLLRRAGARQPPGGEIVHHRHGLAPYDAEEVDGLSCTSVARALFDEMRLGGDVRHAVVALDMAAAAGLISVSLLAEYVARRHGWEGVPLTRAAIGLGVDGSLSPQESRLRLVWVLDAGLPEPLCNVPVFDRHGNLLGQPDLLDVDAGLVVEYDGAHHRSQRRHRGDVAREGRFRDHGLEYTTVVGGDLAERDLVVERMLTARRRARFDPPDVRPWTLTPPPWWEAPEPLDHRLRRLGRVTWPWAA